MRKYNGRKGMERGESLAAETRYNFPIGINPVFQGWRGSQSCKNSGDLINNRGGKKEE